jgi:hypothetical protein
MDNLRGRGVIYLVALASIFVILFGVRNLASILNPILLFCRSPVSWRSAGCPVGCHWC